MASYVTKEFQIRFRRPYPNSLVNKFKRRDLRILVIAVGAVMGHPFVALLAIGSLTHLAVFQILVSGWHTTLRPSRVLTPRTKRGRSPEPAHALLDVLEDEAVAMRAKHDTKTGAHIVKIVPAPQPPGSKCGT